MTYNLTTFLAPLDRLAVERERDRLREQLADYESLLRLIDRHGTGSDSPEPDTQTADATGQPTPPTTNGNGNGGHGNGHTARLSEKREIVLTIMGERPGRWATRDLRKALAKRGIDPQAGTPVKNIMWQLAKAGKVTAAGSGIYEYPPLSTTPDDPRVQEAMGV